MAEQVDEVVVRRRRLSGGARRVEQRMRRKRAKLIARGARKRRLSPLQKAAIRKMKASGVFKKIAQLRQSLELPTTVIGEVTHNPEYISTIFAICGEAVANAADDVKSEAENAAKEFAKEFLNRAPEYSATDVGLAAVQFEMWLAEKSALYGQFVETILDEGEESFTAVFEGAIKKEDVQVLKNELSDMEIEVLVKAGDANYAEGEVSDLTILDVLPSPSESAVAPDDRQFLKVPNESVLKKAKRLATEHGVRLKSVKGSIDVHEVEGGDKDVRRFMRAAKSEGLNAVSVDVEEELHPTVPGTDYKYSDVFDEGGLSTDVFSRLMGEVEIPEGEGLAFIEDSNGVTWVRKEQRWYPNVAEKVGKLGKSEALRLLAARFILSRADGDVRGARSLQGKAKKLDPKGWESAFKQFGDPDNPDERKDTLKKAQAALDKADAGTLASLFEGDLLALPAFESVEDLEAHLPPDSFTPPMIDAARRIMEGEAVTVEEIEEILPAPEQPLSAFLTEENHMVKRYFNVDKFDQKKNSPDYLMAMATVTGIRHRLDKLDGQARIAEIRAALPKGKRGKKLAGFLRDRMAPAPTEAVDLKSNEVSQSDDDPFDMGSPLDTRDPAGKDLEHIVLQNMRLLFRADEWGFTRKYATAADMRYFLKGQEIEATVEDIEAMLKQLADDGKIQMKIRKFDWMDPLTKKPRQEVIFGLKESDTSDTTVLSEEKKLLPPLAKYEKPLSVRMITQFGKKIGSGPSGNVTFYDLEDLVYYVVKGDTLGNPVSLADFKKWRKTHKLVDSHALDTTVLSEKYSEDDVSPQDFTLTPGGPLGSKTELGAIEPDKSQRAIMGLYPTEKAALAAIKKWMSKEGIYPSVWSFSDHGNLIGAVNVKTGKVTESLDEATAKEAAFFLKSGDETLQEYISRVIAYLTRKNKKKPADEQRPRDQIAAIAYSKAEKAGFKIPARASERYLTKDTTVLSEVLYHEDPEWLRSKFDSWCVRNQGTDDGKTLVGFRDATFHVPHIPGAVKDLVEAVASYYDDLPEEFDVMLTAALREYCWTEGTLQEARVRSPISTDPGLGYIGNLISQHVHPKNAMMLWDKAVIAAAKSMKVSLPAAAALLDSKYGRHLVDALTGSINFETEPTQEEIIQATAKELASSQSWRRMAINAGRQFVIGSLGDDNLDSKFSVKSKTQGMTPQVDRVLKADDPKAAREIANAIKDYQADGRAPPGPIVVKDNTVLLPESVATKSAYAFASDDAQIQKLLKQANAEHQKKAKTPTEKAASTSLAPGAEERAYIKSRVLGGSDILRIAKAQGWKKKGEDQYGNPTFAHTSSKLMLWGNEDIAGVMIAPMQKKESLATLVTLQKWAQENFEGQERKWLLQRIAQGALNKKVDVIPEGLPEETAKELEAKLREREKGLKESADGMSAEEFHIRLKMSTGQMTKAEGEKALSRMQRGVTEALAHVAYGDGQEVSLEGKRIQWNKDGTFTCESLQEGQTGSAAFGVLRGGTDGARGGVCPDFNEDGVYEVVKRGQLRLANLSALQRLPSSDNSTDNFGNVRCHGTPFATEALVNGPDNGLDDDAAEGLNALAGANAKRGIIGTAKRRRSGRPMKRITGVQEQKTALQTAGFVKEGDRWVLDLSEGYRMHAVESSRWPGMFMVSWLEQGMRNAWRGPARIESVLGKAEDLRAASTTGGQTVEDNTVLPEAEAWTDADYKDSDTIKKVIAKATEKHAALKDLPTVSKLIAFGLSAYAKNKDAQELGFYRWSPPEGMVRAAGNEIRRYNKTFTQNVKPLPAGVEKVGYIDRQKGKSGHTLTTKWVNFRTDGKGVSVDVNPAWDNLSPKDVGESSTTEAKLSPVEEEILKALYEIWKDDTDNNVNVRLLPLQKLAALNKTSVNKTKAAVGKLMNLGAVEQFKGGYKVDHREAEDLLGIVNWESSTTPQDNTVLSEAEVVNTIIKQIGNQAFTMMGTKRHRMAAVDDNTLGFNIGKNKTSGNWIEVKLDASDTYTVKLIRLAGGKKKEIAVKGGVYADKLKEVIEGMTGLYLSMGKPKESTTEGLSPDAKKAQELGAKAFHKGIKRAPALDPAMDSMIGRKGREGRTDKEVSTILTAWLYGWDKENLKESTTTEGKLSYSKDKELVSKIAALAKKHGGRAGHSTANFMRQTEAEAFLKEFKKAFADLTPTKVLAAPTAVGHPKGIGALSAGTTIYQVKYVRESSTTDNTVLSEQFTTSLNGATKHTHSILTVNKKGNGQTGSASAGPAHTHEIRGWEVKAAGEDKHTHSISAADKKSMKEAMVDGVYMMHSRPGRVFALRKKKEEPPPEPPPEEPPTNGGAAPPADGGTPPPAEGFAQEALTTGPKVAVRVTIPTDQIRLRVDKLALGVALETEDEMTVVASAKKPALKKFLSKIERLGVKWSAIPEEDIPTGYTTMGPAAEATTSGAVGGFADTHLDGGFDDGEPMDTQGDDEEDDEEDDSEEILRRMRRVAKKGADGRVAKDQPLGFDRTLEPVREGLKDRIRRNRK